MFNVFIDTQSVYQKHGADESDCLLNAEQQAKDIRLYRMTAGARSEGGGITANMQDNTFRSALVPPPPPL